MHPSPANLSVHLITIARLSTALDTGAVQHRCNQKGAGVFLEAEEEHFSAVPAP